MKAEAAPMSVADYCQQLIDGRIIVNRDYQREEKIWGPFVRSYFIESILLEFPIPKLFLWVSFDLRTRQSKKEIVDGQQRSHALRMFFENRMTLSQKIATEELRGKKYRDLGDDYRQVFLSYSLPIDEFRRADEDEIRESFARMNVHNTVLNPEELRNAKFSGEFKRFIIQLTAAFRDALVAAKTISRRDTIRMADYRLFSEIVYLLEFGFQTTKGEDIDRLYDLYEAEFVKEEAYRAAVEQACLRWQENDIYQYEEVNNKHCFYSLIVALIFIENPQIFNVQIDGDMASEIERLMEANVSLEELNTEITEFKNARSVDDEPDIRHLGFVQACTSKTNVGEQKGIRFSYFVAALRNSFPA